MILIGYHRLGCCRLHHCRLQDPAQPIRLAVPRFAMPEVGVPGRLTSPITTSSASTCDSCWTCSKLDIVDAGFAYHVTWPNRARITISGLCGRLKFQFLFRKASFSGEPATLYHSPNHYHLSRQCFVCLICIQSRHRRHQRMISSVSSEHMDASW